MPKLVGARSRERVKRDTVTGLALVGFNLLTDEYFLAPLRIRNVVVINSGDDVGVEMPIGVQECKVPALNAVPRDGARKSWKESFLVLWRQIEHFLSPQLSVVFPRLCRRLQI